MKTIELVKQEAANLLDQKDMWLEIAEKQNATNKQKKAGYF